MTINSIKNENEVTMEIIGRLDTTTAPQLEAEIKKYVEEINSLILDFKQLEYISSAGLRVLLLAQKLMNKNGKMIIRHVNETIAEVFDITGFSNILNVE